MNISRSAYFASLQEYVPKTPAITTLLPMFRERLLLLERGMNIIKQLTNHVNPGQIPVLTVDQPLYAIANKIQWSWTTEYGERHDTVLMSGIQVEMNILSLLDDWLEGSCWIYIMTSANVTAE